MGAMGGIGSGLGSFMQGFQQAQQNKLQRQYYDLQMQQYLHNQQQQQGADRGFGQTLMGLGQGGGAPQVQPQAPMPPQRTPLQQGLTPPSQGISPPPASPPAGGEGFNVRAARNNNPGNIMALPGQQSAGLDQGHGVRVFPTMDAGYKAMDDLALRKYRGGATTADALIAGPHGWTPGNHGAAANIARTMGIGPHDDLQLSDPQRLRAFEHALTVQEAGPKGAAYIESRRGKGDGATPSPYSEPPSARSSRQQAQSPQPAQQEQSGPLTIQSVVGMIRKQVPNATPEQVGRIVERFLPLMKLDEQNAWTTERIEMQRQKNEALDAARQAREQLNESKFAASQERSAAQLEATNRRLDEMERHAREMEGQGRQRIGQSGERLDLARQQQAAREKYQQERAAELKQRDADTKARGGMQATQAEVRTQLNALNYKLKALTTAYNMNPNDTLREMITDTIGDIDQLMKTPGATAAGSGAQPLGEGPGVSLKQPQASTPAGTPPQPPTASASPSGKKPVPDQIKRDLQDALAKGAPRQPMLDKLQKDGYDTSGL